MSPAVSLREKFFGCIAGVHAGSAMGAAIEGKNYWQIEEEHGVLDTFLPYHHYKELNSWVREPGTTEDGVERQKLIIDAIVRKGDRVTAEDVRQSWLTTMNPKAAGNLSEPFEGELLTMAKSPLPARDIGRYCDYAGLVSFARSCHPIGLINAGDIDATITDALEVGQLYQTTNSKGIQWATVTAMAVAAATKPDATVDSVIGTVLDRIDTITPNPAGVGDELRRALDYTAACSDVHELARVFEKHYGGWGIPYACSYANEVVTKGMCVFRMVKGNLRDAIIAGVNLGRDTDCTTAVAAGISGALTGGASLPPEWIETVDHATSVNPHTCCRKTMRQHANDLYDAFVRRLKSMRAYINLMGQ